MFRAIAGIILCCNGWPWCGAMLIIDAIFDD